MASWKLAAVLFLAASQPWTLVQGTNINLRPNGIAWQSAAVDDRITLQIGLNESNYDRFVNELQKVSDPRDPSYGKHWSCDKVRDLTVPSSQVRTKVKGWLRSKGFHTVWDDGSWFILNTTIGIANRKFNMTFDQVTVNGVLRTRLLDDTNATYGAPPDVRKEIELIWPFIYSGDRTPPDDETPGSEDAVIRYNWPGYYPGAAVEQYNTEAYQPRAGSKSKLGFPSFQLESADRTKRHQQYFRLPHDDYTRKFMDGLIDYDCGSLCLEASNLDKQGAVTVAESLPIIEYVFGGLSDPLPLLDFLLRLSDQKNDKLPQVMFISYGVSELDVPPAWAKRVCYLMGKLALRGVSFVVASGDHGAGKCRTTDGQNDTVSELSFPATCPWVTAVGATRGSFNDSQEAAGESGGGFSALFPRPDWQESAVSNYLVGQGGAFITRGRGYPDVSAAMSENTSVFSWDSQRHYSGTPYSAPSFAALVALLNDARLSQNKSALGFLNPLLYRYEYRILNDVTRGASTGYSDNCVGEEYFASSDSEIDPGMVTTYGYGWNATEGWDAATGLGTPDFRRMLDFVLRLP